VDDNAELFKDLYDRYLKKEKVMVIADGVCVLDMGKDASNSGVKLGRMVRSDECLEIKFDKERERIALEEPEKLRDLPRFKCRLCGMGLRCHALLSNDPRQCQAYALSFEGVCFSMSVNIPELTDK
jgi:hypothetical protein